MSIYEIRNRAQQAQEVQQAPQGRDYRAIYRAVHEYHERHNPPQLTGEYWRAAATDIAAVSNALDNDPFGQALLMAVYAELEREYKRIKPGESEPPAPNDV